jgi:hypothetical protein
MKTKTPTKTTKTTTKRTPLAEARQQQRDAMETLVSLADRGQVQVVALVRNALRPLLDGYTLCNLVNKHLSLKDVLAARGCAKYWPLFQSSLAEQGHALPWFTRDKIIYPAELALVEKRAARARIRDGMIMVCEKATATAYSAAIAAATTLFEQADDATTAAATEATKKQLPLQ